MKKLLLLIAAVLMLVGCNQQVNTPKPKIDITEKIKGLEAEKIDTENNASPQTQSITKYTSTSGDTNKFNDKEKNVSFNYPLNWEIKSYNPTGDSVSILPDGQRNGWNRIIYFGFNVDIKEQIKKNFDDNSGPGGRASSEESSIGGYKAIKYSFEDGSKYVVQLNNGKFVVVSPDLELTKDREDGIKEILDSLSF